MNSQHHGAWCRKRHRMLGWGMEQIVSATPKRPGNGYLFPVQSASILQTLHTTPQVRDMRSMKRLIGSMK
jgi:hypothetical protein